MTPTISATALGRRYRDQIALDDVSLTVEPGIVTGLLGRNGAGKTTLMRIITGLEFPTAGDIRVFGQVPAENLLVVALSVVYGLGLTLLQLIERATDGWGLRLHFFRIPWIMDGPWYQTWLTSFVLLVLFFLYGMWYGLVFRRWSVPGLVAFIAAQILVALLVVVAVSMTHNWSAFGHFFTTVTAIALTGVLAAVAAAMGLGGLSTIRRVTV